MFTLLSVLAPFVIAQPSAPLVLPPTSVHIAERATLIDGVKSIAAPGVPGPLVLFGDAAFPVVVGKDGKDVAMPVVAAGTLGQGRVVAFGHTGYLDAAALKAGDTGTLMDNALRWAGRREKPRVGVLRDRAWSEALAARGFDATSITTLDRLTEHDSLCLNAHALSNEQRDAVLAFVKSGGGVLVSGLGWGWLQLNPAKSIREHPGNILLADAGIAWGDGSLERTAPDGFAVGGELAPELHANAAIAKLEQPTTAPLTQAAHTLTAAIRVLPSDHALVARCRALLDGHAAPIVPTQGSPIRAKHAVERVLIALSVEMEKRTPAAEIQPNPAADAFPGPVHADAPRIARDITIDASIPEWHSTGLYAPPGAIITVRTDADAKNFRVRLGCHTDHLWHHDKWSRVPDISREWPLQPGVTTIASAFGGLIYLDVPNNQKGERTFTIEGAVESPRFVRGVTTPEEWRRIRAAPGPWGELESRRVIVSVPSAALRTLDDPEALMTFWDAISDAHATLGGVPTPPSRPHRFVADIQISAGYMHSGYPIMTHLDAVDEMTMLDKLKAGSWGLLHELGHNHQVGDWTFDGTGEVTCNLFALHAIDTICTPPAGSRGHPGVNTPPSFANHLAAGAPFDAWKRDPFLALHMYVQLEQAFGWETYKRVFAEYRDLPRAERPKHDADKRDQWMVRFSRACGKNLGPFFQAWGVPTSDAARASIADLPAWMPENWPAK
ncbi:MAG: hypothetical protein HBSAPP03_06680 [Phycisphaerae bacterium]|nr:MAG: hypothetical protein HBSAPP03_06680 [Phycisphaerae bacterium]